MCRFLQIARGSASEVESHFLLAGDLHFIKDVDYQKFARQADEIQRVLTALKEDPLINHAQWRDSKLVARSS